MNSSRQSIKPKIRCLRDDKKYKWYVKDYGVYIENLNKVLQTIVHPLYSKYSERVKAYGMHWSISHNTAKCFNSIIIHHLASARHEKHFRIVAKTRTTVVNNNTSPRYECGTLDIFWIMNAFWMKFRLFVWQCWNSSHHICCSKLNRWFASWKLYRCENSFHHCISRGHIESNVWGILDGCGWAIVYSMFSTRFHTRQKCLACIRIHNKNRYMFLGNLKVSGSRQSRNKRSASTFKQRTVRRAMSIAIESVPISSKKNKDTSIVFTMERHKQHESISWRLMKSDLLVNMKGSIKELLLSLALLNRITEETYTFACYLSFPFAIHCHSRDIVKHERAKCKTINVEHFSIFFLVCLSAWYCIYIFGAIKYLEWKFSSFFNGAYYGTMRITMKTVIIVISKLLKKTDDFP